MQNSIMQFRINPENNKALFKIHEFVELNIFLTESQTRFSNSTEKGGL